MWWVILSAAAQEPEPSTEVADEEIMVYGEAVERARAAVVAELQGMGYDHVRKRDDRLVFLHEQGWKGKVVFYDDGRLATKRRGFSGRELPPIPGTRIRPYP